MAKCSSRPNKKNILITGGGGFIGRNLRDCLEGKYNIFTLDPKIKNKKDCDTIRLDLTNRRKVKSFFSRFSKKRKINIIIHMAGAMASADNINELAVLNANLKITEGLIETAKILKPGKIINFSSIAVYPNTDGWYDESSEIRPSANTDCLYGLSKFCSEEILNFTLRKEKTIISHLRISQVYGKGMRQDRVIPAMLKELKKKNTITVFGAGERVSNFIHIEKLLKIIEVFIDTNLPGVYNIGYENISYLNLAKRLIREHGDKKSKVFKKSKGARARFYLDTSKLKALEGVI